MTKLQLLHAVQFWLHTEVWKINALGIKNGLSPLCVILLIVMKYDLLEKQLWPKIIVSESSYPLASVHRAIDYLEDKGLLKTSVDEQDKRRVLVKGTLKTHEVISELLSNWKKTLCEG